MANRIKDITVEIGGNTTKLQSALMNILAARNRESGNLEIGVPVLGNHLFCA